MSLNDSFADTSGLMNNIGYWQPYTHSEKWAMPPTEINFPMSRINQVYQLEWSLISGYEAYDYQDDRYILGATGIIHKPPVDPAYSAVLQSAADLIANIQRG